MPVWQPTGSVTLNGNGSAAIQLSWSFSYNDQYSSPYAEVTVTNDSTGATVFYQVVTNTTTSSTINIYNIPSGTNYTATLYVSAYYFIAGYSQALYAYSHASTTSPTPSAPTWTSTSISQFIKDTNVQTSGRTYTVSASGATSYSASGTLPSGVSFSGGAFSGVPTTAGQSYSFTITASNSGGSVTASYSGNVADTKYGKIWVYDGSAWVECFARVYDASTGFSTKASMYTYSATNGWVKVKPKDAINY